MEKSASPAGRAYIVIMFIVGWFTLIGQLVLMLGTKAAPATELVMRFFTFYTILTNLLLAVCFTFMLLKPRSKWNDFFTSPAMLAAAATYITVVSVTYNIILRFIWSPQGLQRVVDELLHLIIPILYIIFWLIFVPKGGLKWKNVFPLLVYPLVYLCVILIRGAMSGWYPYPFVDVNQLGYGKALLNSGMITIAFIIIALLFVLIDSKKSKRAFD
ncbi:MAG TPA: Pr6Pr family membrane protein [Mucilaginibacter sp.]|nr:Pr6Pr family membrane protein [Mucilaginibacter sp.]